VQTIQWARVEWGARSDQLMLVVAVTVSSTTNARLVMPSDGEEGYAIAGANTGGEAVSAAILLCMPPGETLRTKQGGPNLRCVHGFDVHADSAPQGLICSSLGLQMPQ
jgi:hypothetical protein